MISNDGSLAALLNNKRLAALASRGTDWLLDECHRLAMMLAPGAVSASVRMTHKHSGRDYMVLVEVISQGYGPSDDKAIASVTVALNSHESARRVALAVVSTMLRDKAKACGIKIPRRPRDA